MLRTFLYQLNKKLLFWKGNLLSRTASTTAVDFPVDFVVTWVNEHDQKWLAQKNELLEKNGSSVRSDNGEERYRDWNLFHYWFRSVEKYAPWVRRVYLVTCGHIPDWLNTLAPKLVVIAHKDYIPEKYLPTFSPNPIELNLHHIPDLSEHFVYFNDDVFLTAPVRPEDFFDGPYPKCCSIAFPLKNDYHNDSFNHQLFSNLGIFNSYWKGHISLAIKKHPEKWLSYRYGHCRKYNLAMFDADYIPGMYFSHLPAPFCKNTFERVWHDIPDILDETCKHPFRTPRDVIHQIVTLWDLVMNNYSPVEPDYYGIVFSNLPHQIEDISKIFASHTAKSICLNDTDLITREEYLSAKEKIGQIMQAAFPDKSSFEK